MCQKYVKIFSALINDCSKTNNFRSCADDNQQPKLTIILKMFDIHFIKLNWLSDYFAILSSPLSSFWIYSKEAILAFVSSKLSRFVFSELNSVNVTLFSSPSEKYLS